MSPQHTNRRAPAATALALTLLALFVWLIVRRGDDGEPSQPGTEIVNKDEREQPVPAKPDSETEADPAESGPSAAVAELKVAPDLDEFGITVVDEDTGEPIAGAHARAKQRYRFPRKSPAYEKLAGVPTVNTVYDAERKTDASGKAVLFWADDLVVTVEASGYQMTSVPAPPDAEVGVVLSLAPAIRITGRVVSENGKPLEGAVVRAVEYDRTDLFQYGHEWVEDIVRTGADGKFVVDHLPPAEGIVLEAKLDGWLPGRIDVEEVDHGSPVEDVEIVLVDGAGTIEGVVLDPDGKPVSGAEVAIHLSFELGKPYFSSYGWPDQRTDGEGRFRFTSLPLRRYGVHFCAPGYDVRLWRKSVTLTGETPHASITLQLKSSPFVKGVVVDPDGNPLVGVTVRTMMAHTFSSRTGEDGRFSLPLQGTTTVYFSKAGFARIEKKLSADVEEAKVEMSLSARLDVRLRTPRGGAELLPAFYVEVWVHESDDGRAASIDSHRRVVRNPRGEFSFDLTPGYADVRVIVPGYVPIREKIDLDGGRVHAVELHLERGNAIRSRVVRHADGSAVSGALVVLQESDELPRFLGYFRGHDRNFDFAQTRTGSDGSFELRGVPAVDRRGNETRWRLWVRARGMAVARTDSFSVSSGSVHRVIRLVNEARIEARIKSWETPESVMLRSPEALTAIKMSVDDNPPPGNVTTLAEVLAREKLRYGLSTTHAGLSHEGGVGEDGRFSIEELPPGSYELLLLGWSRFINLAAGETKEVVIDLASVKPPLRGRLLRGGKPLAGVSIVYGTPGRNLTDDDGIFDGLWRGQQRLAIGWDFFEPYSFADVFVGEDEEGIIDIETGSAAISGTVEFEQPPAGECKIHAVPSSATGIARLGAVVARTRADVGESSRRFHLPGLLPGRYVVVVLPPAPHPMVVSPEIRVKDGETRRGLKLLVPATAAGAHDLLVRFAHPPIAEEIELNIYHPLLRSSPITDGIAEFKRLPNGEYFGFVPIGGENLASPLVHFTLPREGPLDVRIGRGGTVVAKVEADGTGPVSGARLSVYHATGIDLLRIIESFELPDGVRIMGDFYYWFAPLTNENGVTSLESPLAAGTYEVSARWRDTESPRVKITVRDGETTWVRLRVPSR